MPQTMQTCKGCSTTVQSEFIISWVCNIQGQRKMSCGPVKKVIINKFKGKKRIVTEKPSVSFGNANQALQR